MIRLKNASRGMPKKALEAEYREEFWLACENLHKHVIETDTSSLNVRRRANADPLN